MKFRQQLTARVTRVLLGSAVCALVGCGSSDNGNSGRSDAGSDTTPPKFAGLKSATVDPDTNAVDLTWDAASDNDSMPANIAYAIYVGSKAGEEDFSSPFAFTPSGATGASLSTVVPGNDYFWVVRAIDPAGNEDDNKAELPASPTDTTAPRFAGVTVVTVKTSHSALVEWKPARDDASAAKQIVYKVFVSTNPDPTSFDLKHPSGTSMPGDTSLLVSNLDPLTNYYFMVRSLDDSGNSDDNTRVLSGSTPEGEPPTFNGLKQLNPLSEGVKLYWLSAQDNLTDVANIVYNVYVTTNDAFTASDLEAPTYTSPPGAVTFIVPNLINQQRYSFIVRAQDTAGNEDQNTTTLTTRALSGKDTSPPSFDATTVKVTGDSPSALLVTWKAGSDLVTDPTDLVYSLYLSSTSAPIPDGTAPTIVTAPGATSALLAGLPPQTTRYVTVRCSDRAGNALANTVATSGTTLPGNPADITAPTLTTSPVVTTDNSRPTSLNVTWTNGADDVSALSALRYRVCAQPLESDCLGANFVNHVSGTSQAGKAQITLNGLISRTKYFVYVRVEDEAGHLSVADNGTSATTPTSFTRDVNTIFFDKCDGCHSFDIKSTVGVEGGFVDTRLPFTTTSMFLVAPGNPRDSLIYRRINPLGLGVAPFGTPAGAGATDPNVAITDLYRGPQEPQNAQRIFAGALSPEEDGAIRDWITQGANAN